MGSLFAQQDTPADTPTPLILRGDTKPTGLYGYFDWQSNASSPRHLKVGKEDANKLQCVLLSALDSSDAVTSRRMGHAYSNDGGETWTANRAIINVRPLELAFQTSSTDAPYIATYCSYGVNGGAVHVFSAPSPGADFSMIGRLPNVTESGREEKGMAWPAMVLSKDDTKGVFMGKLNTVNAADRLPLQTIALDLATGQPATPRWRNIADSSNSNDFVNRQEYAMAHSPRGAIGVAYYQGLGSDPITYTGIYFTESTDDGATWSQPEPILVGGGLVTDGYNLNGDPDTVLAGNTIDITYRGEEPQIVFNGDVFRGSPPFSSSRISYQNILYWSRSKGLKMIARSHQVPWLGGYAVPSGRAQSQMTPVSFPSISVGEDGQHIVVTFMAVAQELDENGSRVSVASDDGFLYYRLWAVGSSDRGLTWGTPFIVQDFAGGGGDSASIEYPSSSEIGRMVDGNYELRLVYQAKRYPGLFSVSIAGQKRGRMQQVHQYFQRFMVTPEMFRNTSSVAGEHIAPASAAISRIHPNPAISDITVEYNLASSGVVDITLMNSLGKEVLREHGGVVQYAGTHTRTINVSDLPAGSYRCAIRQNGITVTRMVNVVR